MTPLNMRWITLIIHYNEQLFFEKKEFYLPYRFAHAGKKGEEELGRWGTRAGFADGA